MDVLRSITCSLIGSNPVTGYCPLVSSKVEIKPLKVAYTVVLDKNGLTYGAYDILEFEVTGPPNYLIDIQLSKGDAALFTNGLGIVNSWDQSKLPKDRINVKTFSSWTNGDTTLRLNGSGKTNYKVPLDWWRDLARQPLSSFNTMTLYMKVLAVKKATDTVLASAISDVTILNNLESFRINDFGYINGGTKKSMNMVFTVREPNTTDMYTFVQWKKGGRKNWDVHGHITRPPVRDYGIRHISDYPRWTIDRVNIDPRYRDGNYRITNGGKTATTLDKPSSSRATAIRPHTYTNIEFETRIHLNYDVPPRVTITRQDGSPPIYGVVLGVIGAPEPLILENDFWESHILQVWDPVSRSAIITHPAAYAGPGP